MTEPADMLAWLRAQLDEDERDARAAGPGRWHARVLRDIDAHRRIIDHLESRLRMLDTEIVARTSAGNRQALVVAIEVLESTVRTIGATYDDRPGYRDDWRP